MRQTILNSSTLLTAFILGVFATPAIYAQTPPAGSGSAATQSAAEGSARTLWNHHSDLTSQIQASNIGQLKQIRNPDVIGPATTSVWVDGGRAFIGPSIPEVFGDWAEIRNVITAFRLSQQ